MAFGSWEVCLWFSVGSYALHHFEAGRTNDIFSFRAGLARGEEGSGERPVSEVG